MTHDTAETPIPSLVCPGCGSRDVDLRRGPFCGTCAEAIAEEASGLRPCDCGPDDRCSDCTPPDELAAAIRVAVREIVKEGTS